MRKLLISVKVLSLLLILFTILIGCDDEPRVVTFPDPNVELAIREALGKPEGDIISSDLEKLTDLTLGRLTMEIVPELRISNITGLEYCSNLIRLSIWSYEISDISPLSNLTKLRELYLGGGQLSDVTPLSKLTNLTKLTLSCDLISDISPLANLIKLTELDIGFSNVSDISSLSGLTNLTELWLKNNKISDIKPLVENSGLSEGDYLNLNSNLLSPESILIYIPKLEARGVRVYY